MSEVLIRPIREADNKIIASIIRSVLTEFGANKPGTVYYDPSTDDLYALFQARDSAYFILEVDGEVCGGSGIYPTIGLPSGCTEIVKLYIMPNVRGRGLGRALLENCFEIATQLGYKQVYLETLPELKMAVGLYENCGFRYLDKPLGNSGHFGCDLWMLKDL
jgi:putative acetyltransferase